MGPAGGPASGLVLCLDRIEGNDDPLPESAEIGDPPCGPPGLPADSHGHWLLLPCHKPARGPRDIAFLVEQAWQPSADELILCAERRDKLVDSLAGRYDG